MVILCLIPSGNYINAAPAVPNPTCHLPGSAAGSLLPRTAVQLHCNVIFLPPRPPAFFCHQKSFLPEIFNPVCSLNSCETVSLFISITAPQYIVFTHWHFSTASETATHVQTVHKAWKWKSLSDALGVNILIWSQVVSITASFAIQLWDTSPTPSTSSSSH